MSELEKDLRIIMKEMDDDYLYPEQAQAYVAARLAGLGYVKVVRCGECKYRIPSEEEPLTSGYCEIDADCFGAVVNMSIDHFCGHGERVADATGEEVSNA